jgi:hypothetical protein
MRSIFLPALASQKRLTVFSANIIFAKQKQNPALLSEKCFAVSSAKK